MRTFPTAAIFRGKPARVLSYEGNGFFRLLDSQDERRLLQSFQFTFLSDESKQATSEEEGAPAFEVLTLF
jgi:hypothetical protein